MRHSDLKKAFGLFGYFFSAYPGRSGAMILAMLLAAATEGLGIAALLPLLRIATDADETTHDGIGKWVDQGFAAVNITPSIGNLLILVTLAIALKSLLVFLAMREVGTTAARVAMDLRLDLARALMQARWLFYVRQRLGSLAAALTGEPARASAGYVAACRLLVALIQAIAFCAVAASISWQVTAIALATGLISFPVLAGFVRVSRRAGQANTRLSRRFVSRLVESLGGIKAIKATAGEARLGAYLETDIRALNQVQRRLIVSREGLAQIQEPLKVVALAAALYILLGSWSGGLEALAVLAILFSRAVQRIQQVQRHYQEITQQLPAFWFIRAITRRAQTARESLTVGESPAFSDRIVFRGVSFAYDRKTVLHGIDLTIPAGRMVGIVGASGVGKTTIADLAIGLLRPTSGQIEIDGMSLDEIDMMAWRHQIGYVPQDTLLFHDTVMTNLTLGDPALNRDQAEVALRRAGAWDFVAALPDGLQSVIGEKGASLSGGQRQRLAIARALIRNPALLILDEATTALDPKTEAILCQSLRQLLPDVTVLAISHQTAVVDVADIVYRLDERGLTVQATRGDPVRAEAVVP